MQILDGNKVAEKKLAEIEDKIIEKIGVRAPKLEIILVGDDFSSQKYVEYKQKAAEKIGISVSINKFPKDCDINKILNVIGEFNANHDVDGIMVQLPLPENFNEAEILNRIDSSKDVDGLTDLSANRIKKFVSIQEDIESSVYKLTESEEVLGRDISRDDVFVPATAMAIIEILQFYKIPINEKIVTVIGSSKIVGMPTAVLMSLLGGDVTICRSKTPNISSYTKQSDIVISATGVPLLVKADWINEDAVVIDVGFTKDVVTGKTMGDVDYENVAPKCSYISKAIGGVGPVTIACLLFNTVCAWGRNV